MHNANTVTCFIVCRAIALLSCGSLTDVGKRTGGTGIKMASIESACIESAGVNTAGVNTAGVNTAGINAAGINAAGIKVPV